MRHRAFSLRTFLTGITIAVVLVSTAMSMSLIALTDRLHTASRNLADRVDRVHLIGEARAELLLHGRAADRLVARDIEARVWDVLDGVSKYPRTTDEARALKEVSERLTSYFAAARAPADAAALGRELEAAYQSLAALIDTKLEHARRAREEVARWDETANRLGIGAAVVVFLLAAGFLWWLRARAFRSLWSLRAAMDRFARGDRHARASEQGPAELLALASRFNEMASDLALRREAQMAFLGSVAHDIRNPLGALKLSMLSLQRGAVSPERLHHFVGVANRQITRIERLLGDLMDTAKIEAGRVSLQLAPRDLRDLVLASTELYEASSPKHTLSVELPSEPLFVLCDALRIEQVLGNLISNAVKYSPQGGTVVVSLVRGGQDAVLSVSDTGVGISDEDAKRLFEPFRRLVAPDSGIPGVGLGLFVVRQIVSAHGGDVEVDSKPGVGTTFRLRLPLAPTSGTSASDTAQLNGDHTPHVAN